MTVSIFALAGLYFNGPFDQTPLTLSRHPTISSTGTLCEGESMRVKDEVFREVQAVTDFDFGEKVAAVFDDMLDRSVPFYREIQRMISEIASDLAVKGTNIYDLGCSTGNTLLGLDSSVHKSVKF